MSRKRGAVLCLLLLAGLLLWQLAPARPGEGRALAIGIISSDGRDVDGIRAAWSSVLQEEGLVHEWLTATEVGLLDTTQLLSRWRALVLPDRLAQHLPDSLAERLERYVRAGGSVVVVSDAGTKRGDGTYRQEGLFTDLLGVDYLRYERLGDDAYREGVVRFADSEAARSWHVPPGKLSDDVVGGYAYGDLAYPMSAARVIARDVRTWASDGRIPVLSTRRVGGGRVLWANLPLGYLKSHGDDLPLRLTVLGFLVDRVGLPRVMPTEEGLGGLVIDWHLDSAVELENFPRLLARGLVRRELRYQFDVTAGPDRDRPGDGLGLDACGKGRDLVRTLMPYGEIGSHGGWGHNYFAVGIERRTLDRDSVADLVRRNNDCLEQVTGRSVRGFAAPQGVHPRYLTDILARTGIRSYYYTGDTGSPPNRTFLNGHRVSSRAWAFPVMPNGQYASIGEMERAEVSPEDVRRWLGDTLRYVQRARSVRLVYSHPYDLSTPEYLEQFKGFTDDVVQAQAAGRLRVGSMSDFRRFSVRMLRTHASFVVGGGRLSVRLQNPVSLQGIAIELPPGRTVRPTSTLSVRPSRGGRVLVTVDAPVREVVFTTREVQPIG